MRSLRGSMTTELSILFPVVFILLMLMMTTGLSSLYLLCGSILTGESLMIAEVSEKEGKKATLTLEAMEGFLEEEAPTDSMTFDVSGGPSFFRTKYATQILVEPGSGSFRPFNLTQTKNVIDPVVFRARVDLVYEVIHK